MTGTVKWFNAQKGYGFIEDSEGRGEFFAHYSGIFADGFKTLEEGQKVKFDVIDTEKGKQAVNIEVINENIGGQEDMMNKKQTIEKIMEEYSKYGIVNIKEMAEELYDSAIQAGVPHEMIYSGMKMMFNQALGIDNTETVEEIDAMDWMLTHQLSSKNLSVGEKLAMTEEFKKEVSLENEKKKLSTLKQNSSNRSLQLERTDDIDFESKKTSHSETWTDNQIAKKAGVGTGSVARYNKIMKSDNEELKEQVKTGQVTVNKAYEEVRKREVRTCKVCGMEKKIIDFFGNDTICKECTRKESEKNINLPKMQNSAKVMENMNYGNDKRTVCKGNCRVISKGDNIQCIKF